MSFDFVVVGPSLKKTLLNARKQGTLDLSNRSLEEVPNEVYHIYEVQLDGDALDWSKSSSKWWEQSDTLFRLRLNRNKLTSISDEIGLLADLQLLDVSFNHLTALPQGLGSLAALRAFDCSSNKLSSLPDVFGSLPALESVNFSSNCLTALPGSFSQLSNLKELNISRNNIRSLPTSLHHSRELQKLDCSHNALSSLPVELPSSLISVDASHNRLTSILFVKSLQGVVELRISGNRLTSLPRELAGCEKLTLLEARENRLLKLGEGLPQLNSLKMLDLAANKLTSEAIETLCGLKLQRLDLSSNSLAGLPPLLGKMESLQVLSVEGNPIRSIRQELLVTSRLFDLLEFLRSRLPEDESATSSLGGNEVDILISNAASDGNLPLSNKGLSEVPQMLFTLTQLGKLDLSKNPLRSLPNDVASLTRLEWFDLSGTQLSGLPDGFSHLGHSLLELKLCQCRALRAPLPVLGSLRALRVLDLAAVPQAALILSPDVCAGLRGLIELRIGYSQLDSLPQGLPELSALTILDASNNNIVEIDFECFRHLSKLHTLNLSNNSLTKVPPEMGLLPLRSFGLTGNPLRQMLRVIEKGTPATLQYLKDRIPV